VQIKCVSPSGARLGEGALWDAERGLVWWVDIKSPAIHAHHAATGANHVQPLSFRLTALGLASDGRLVGACDHGFVRLAVARDMSVSAIEVLARIDEPAGNRFNDGKVDDAGRFWVGTMDDEERAPRGSLYRLDKSGKAVVVRRGIMVPNGPAFLADGTLLITDSACRVITAVSLDDEGNPRGERLFARFTQAQGYPDGMTVDDADHVWIAFWDGWCLRRLSPAGDIVSEIPLPVQRPTCPTFGGEGLDRLYVTSATVGLSPETLAGQPLAGGLLTFVPGIRGRPPARFAG
jgi:xylono-1,5-lactonase